MKITFILFFLLHYLQGNTQNEALSQSMEIQMDRLAGTGKPIQLDSVFVNGKKMSIAKKADNIYTFSDEILNNDSLELRAFTPNRIYQTDLGGKKESNCLSRYIFFYKQKDKKTFAGLNQCSSLTYIQSALVYERVTNKLLIKESSVYQVITYKKAAKKGK